MSTASYLTVSTEFLRVKWQQIILYILLATIAAIGTLIVSLSVAATHSENSNTQILRGLQIVHAWRFFTKRYDFITGNFRRTSKNAFEFYVNEVGSICRFPFTSHF